MSTNSDMPDKYSRTSNTDNHVSAGSAGEFYTRGLQRHQAGHLDGARVDYRNVLRLQPEHADALHMLGVLAYQVGQYDEALSLISRAGKLMPPNAGVYSNLGNVLQARGSWKRLWLRSVMP